MFSPRMVAASVLSLVLGAPALAAPSGIVKPPGPAELVDESAQIIHYFRPSNPEFSKLLVRAKGVFIVPTLAKGAGGSGGTGVLVAHHSVHWSEPAFLTLDSIPVDAQSGGRAGPVVIFLMTDKAVSAFARGGKFSIDRASDLTIFTWSPNAKESVGKADVVVWSGPKGPFAGSAIEGADAHANTSYDKAYYNDKYTTTMKIISRDAGPAKSHKLQGELPS